MVIAAHQERSPFAEWMEENPLRRWRYENGCGVMETAARLGVSMTVIQLWERGVHVPRAYNLERIANLVGEGTIEAWNDWIERRPPDVGRY